MNAPASGGERAQAVFRQLTPLVLLGVLAATLLEPWLPGASWLRDRFGDTAVLRLCVAVLAIYVLLLWGEALRLHGNLTGVLAAFRQFASGTTGPAGAGSGARNPKARVEAAKLLVAALRSDDPEIRATSHHNLVRLAGKDLGTDPSAWQPWIAEQAAALRE